jgi:hypothetical protein
MKSTDGVTDDFRLDPSLAITDTILKQALDYWNAKRAERFAPARSEIEPRGARAFIPHLQIFEVIDGGRAIRTRLAGTAIVAKLKEDTTGQTFDDASPRPVVARTLKAVRWVIANKKPLRTFAQRTALEGRDFLSHETLFMPLSDDAETVNMIAVVGAFTPATGD